MTRCFVHLLRSAHLTGIRTKPKTAPCCFSITEGAMLPRKCRFSCPDGLNSTPATWLHRVVIRPGQWLVAGRPQKATNPLCFTLPRPSCLLHLPSLLTGVPHVTGALRVQQPAAGARERPRGCGGAQGGGLRARDQRALRPAPPPADPRRPHDNAGWRLLLCVLLLRISHKC